MLSENNEYVEEMVRSLFKFNSDDQIREQCEDIEIELAARKARYREQEELTARLQAELAEKDEVLAEKDAELARLKTLLKEHNIEV